MIDLKSKEVIFNRIGELENQIIETKKHMETISDVRWYKKHERIVEDLKLLKKLNEAILYKNTGLFHNTTVQ